MQTEVMMTCGVEGTAQALGARRPNENLLFIYRKTKKNITNMWVLIFIDSNYTT